MLLDDRITERIRLHGIDCPERKQDFYKVAKDYLASMIAGQIVTVTRMDTDRYGRTIGMVFTDDKNVNEEMITAGLAWHYKRFDNNPVWAAMEREAAEKRIGLWSHADPVEPWVFRKR